MDWLILALLCAFFLATADSLSKRYQVNYDAFSLMIARIILPGVLLLPVLWFEPFPQVAPEFWYWVALLMPLELAALLLYAVAIRDAPLSKTAPYLAFTPVFVLLTGWLILGETVSMSGAFGVIMIVIGTYVLNMDSDWQRNWMAPLRAVFQQKGTRYMLLVAFIYGITSVLGKGAMLHATPLSFGAFYYVLLAIVTSVLIAFKRPASLKLAFTLAPAPWLIALCMVAMILTHFAALALTTTAYMIAVKRLSLLFAIIYGACWFNEHGLQRNLIAGSIMVGGVALILLGS